MERQVARRHCHVITIIKQVLLTIFFHCFRDFARSTIERLMGCARDNLLDERLASFVNQNRKRAVYQKFYCKNSSFEQLIKRIEHLLRSFRLRYEGKSRTYGFT
jgi:hypothetical protein